MNNGACSGPGGGEVRRQKKTGAGNGARTRDIKLGKLALYQLSYARSKVNLATSHTHVKHFRTRFQRSVSE